MACGTVDGVTEGSPSSQWQDPNLTTRHNVKTPLTQRGFRVWARLDSNQGPTDYESAALTS
jgi:hypothetical protein